MPIKLNRKFRKQRLVAEINITPFTDVILVLLVIFMITTPLISQASLQVKLPEAKSAKPLAPDEGGRATVTITNEGVVYLNDKVVTRQEVRERLKSLHSKDPQMSVVLRADKSVRFKDIIDVLDSLNELGIGRLDIETMSDPLR